MSYKITEVLNRLAIVRFNKGIVTFDHSAMRSVFEQPDTVYSEFEVTGHISSCGQQDMSKEHYLKYLDGTLKFDELCKN